MDQQTILAVVSEHDGNAVRERAIQLARASGAGVILWDADAGQRLLEDPLPTAWSADGEQEQFGDRLTISDLEAAGRAPLARQVRAVEAAGVPAWGWLPRNQDPDELAGYARRHGARTIVIGEGSEVAEGLVAPDLRVEVVLPA